MKPIFRAALLACLLAGASPLPLPALAAPKKAPAAPARMEPLPHRIKKLVAQKRHEELIRALRAEKTDLGGARAFLLGHAHLALEEFGEAARAFEEALSRIPALEKYALLFLAKAAIGAEDTPRARRALEKLIGKGGRIPSRVFVFSELIRIHREEGNPRRAAELANRYIRSYPENDSVPNFLLWRADALSEAGRTREAALALRRLWRRHPEHPGAERAGKRADRLARKLSPPLKRPGPRALFARAQLLRKRYRFEKALRAYREVERRFPKAGYHSAVTFGVARTLFSLRKTEEAEPALKHAIRHHAPGSRKRTEARYFLARNHLRKRDQPAFEAEARRLLRETPGGGWAARTRFLLARVKEDDRAFGKAARYYRELISKHPGTSHAPRARFRLAWLRFQQKDYARAHKGFDKMAAVHPAHWLISSALYWAGVSAEKQGRRARAIARYRTCAAGHRHRYYGHQCLRALARLAGKEGAREAAPPPPRRAGYEKWANPPPKGAAGSRAAGLLSDLGLHEYAGDEYNRLGSAPYYRYQAARAFSAAGENHRAIHLINKSFWDAVRAGGSDLSPEFWKTVYPLVVRRTEPGGADLHLVNAIIRAESAFNPRAISPAGARGLMQLMPATGRRLARKHKTRLRSVRDLFDPEINTRLGARHLGALVREFGGAIVPAIASYNAGRGAVKRWWKSGRNKPREIFIEEIPYQETKAYVKRVLGYYEEYRRIYGGASPAGAKARR